MRVTAATHTNAKPNNLMSRILAFLNRLIKKIEKSEKQACDAVNV